MIIYSILVVLKAMFMSLLLGLKSMFPYLWANISSGLNIVSQKDFFKFGVGIVNLIIGNEFLFSILSLALIAHITIRIARLIIGFFSKG